MRLGRSLTLIQERLDVLVLSDKEVPLEAVFTVVQEKAGFCFTVISG